jgi:hypothetical protein
MTEVSLTRYDRDRGKSVKANGRTEASSGIHYDFDCTFNPWPELTINPRRPDTDSAVEAAKKESLAGALNKLAEYGYRLLDGTVLPLCLDAAEGTIFMYRER